MSVQEILTLAISLLAVGFSVYAFRQSFSLQRRQFTLEQKQSGLERNLRDATFHVERNIGFEGKLANWHAFEFYGIDVDYAKKNNVMPEQINFLVLYVNAMVALCLSEGKDIYKHLANTDYDARMFSQQHTRRTWQYARRCTMQSTREIIDRYISDNYGEQYESL